MFRKRKKGSIWKDGLLTSGCGGVCHCTWRRSKTRTPHLGCEYYWIYWFPPVSSVLAFWYQKIKQYNNGNVSLLMFFIYIIFNEHNNKSYPCLFLCIIFTSQNDSMINVLPTFLDALPILIQFALTSQGGFIEALLKGLLGFYPRLNDRFSVVAVASDVGLMFFGAIRLAAVV